MIDAVYYSFSLTSIAGRNINGTARFIVSYPPGHSVDVCSECNKSSYKAGCPVLVMDRGSRISWSIHFHDGNEGETLVSVRVGRVTEVQIPWC